MRTRHQWCACHAHLARGAVRGSVAVALRKVESGARAAGPPHCGFERSLTVQRVSALRPSCRARHPRFARLHPPLMSY
ncbi:unnamed protein product, partial [Iphiclides podalirius]